ncbi:MAG: substrate-binding periplasmic protein [Telluria sp.]
MRLTVFPQNRCPVTVAWRLQASRFGLSAPGLVRRWGLALLLGAGFALGPAAAGAQTTVVYPRGPDGAPGFPEQVLELALQRSDSPYRLRLSQQVLTQARALALLEAGKGIDVVNYMTSADREERLLPIRIPIDKGLLGMRLLLIHHSAAARFRAITRADELKRLLAGQGSDWPDTDILRRNGFRVYTTTNYAGLFKMLDSARIDYFPRSIGEIWDEAARHAADGLIVEPTLMLRYPTASYFFVNRHNPKLAAAISAGLEAMRADGTFDRLFDQFYGDLIRRAKIASRTVLYLPNPLLPPGTPLERKELWMPE